MEKFYRCKKEYVDECGFIAFSPNKEYILLEIIWYGNSLIDNYDRRITVHKKEFFEYFYTEAQVKAIKRKEIIEKLNK